MSIYKIGTCNYCDEENQILRPSPFMADVAMMCEHCWNETQEEYKNSTGEYIPNFQDNKEDYEEAKNNINPKADIRIISEPVWVKFDCPFCGEEIEMLYDDFNDLIGCEVCDWEYSNFECPKCSKKIEIDDVEWD
ncbi:hypothetical protein FDC58_10520 [Clostridium botulinum]|nr:hypothetical protein [Clostridium botulinum]NFP29671.1 hypothetical protein [Clostridium botulinum]